jgi:hypothetical protein
MGVLIIPNFKEIKMLGSKREKLNKKKNNPDSVITGFNLTVENIANLKEYAKNNYNKNKSMALNKILEHFFKSLNS